MKKYLLSEADRKELARALSKERSAPPRPMIPESQKIVVEEGDSYWALPPCETGIPAAEMIDGKLSTVGIQCCLFRHAWGEDEMEPLLDPVGNPIRVTVWNYYERRENGLIQVYKHKDGTWTNERPEVPVTSTTGAPVVSTLPPVGDDATCEGNCFWQADADGVWQWPIGGCANATTTSTTTTSTTSTTTTTGSPGLPGGTRYPEPPPATVAPCFASKCVLVCVDTSTTPVPDGYGVPVPYVRYRYELKEGESCPEGCTCYGLGDPCFLVEGELVSSCIGQGPTTTSTTTPNPNAAPCVQAEFIFGTVPPQVYRAATANNGAVDFQTCGTCAPGSEPLYPLGGEVYRRHDWPNLGTVYETPCVESPCPYATNIVAGGRAVFIAWPWQTQVDKWGYTTGATFYDRLASRKKFLANWFYCNKCAGDARPELPPPIWIYEDEAINKRNGVEYDPASDTYSFLSPCISGYSCDTCGRAPTRRVWEYQGPPTTSPPTFGPTTSEGPTTTGGPTSTTTSTTTVAPDCGCIRPGFCPRPYECFRSPCVRGGEVVNGTPIPTTTFGPKIPCFPDSTTTTGAPATTTASPGTTSYPYQCYDSYGNLCNCAGGPGGGTTIPPGVNPPYPPCGGTCGPGAVLTQTGDRCSPPICVVTSPPLETTSVPLPVCQGVCEWEAVAAAGCDDPPPVWVLLSNTCVFGYRCGCSRPSGPPSACGVKAITGCSEYQPPTTNPPTTSPPPPCSCCRSTTTPNPCAVGVCRYNAVFPTGWALVRNTCPNDCRCPDPGGLAPPAQSCDSFTLACGSVLPPTSTVPPTSTSTTSNPMGCCSFASTGGSCYHAFKQACEGLGGQHFAGGTCALFGDGNVYCIPGSTTTPNPELGCCLYQRQGSLTNFCSGATRAQCEIFGGRWSSGSCDRLPDGNFVCVSGTTTTTIGPLRGACCFILAGSYSCMENATDSTCEGLGGIFFTNGSCLSDPCPAGTTTTTSTTTTTTTPCPCPYTNCSCPGAASSSPSCAPGFVWDCDVCGCVAVLGACCFNTNGGGCFDGAFIGGCSRAGESFFAGQTCAEVGCGTTTTTNTPTTNEPPSV